jgi:hypothetical protein
MDIQTYSPILCRQSARRDLHFMDNRRDAIQASALYPQGCPVQYLPNEIVSRGTLHFILHWEE